MRLEFTRVTDQAVWDVAAHPSLGRIVVVLAASVDIWDAEGAPLKRIPVAADFGCFDGSFVYLKQRSDGALLRVSLDADADVEPALAKPVGRLLTRVCRSAYGLVGGDWNGSLHLWDTDGLAILRTFQLPGDGPARVAALPDGERVVVHGGTAGVHVVRIQDGTVERTFHPKGGHDTVLVHGRHVLTYSSPQRTECWDVDTGTRVWRLVARSEGTLGELLWGDFVYGSNSGVFLVDLSSGVAKARIATAHETPALLLLLADGRGFAVNDDRMSLSIWTAAGSSPSTAAGHQGAIRHASVHPGQPLAYTWGWEHDRTVRAWRC